jgi:O-antigen ligase
VDTSLGIGLTRQAPAQGAAYNQRLAPGRPMSNQADSKRLAWVIPREGLQLVLFLLVVFSISRIHQHYGFLGAIRPGITLLALGGLFAVMSPKSIDLSGFSTRPIAIVTAIVVLACVSVPLGISMGNSARFLLEAFFRMLAVYVLVLLAIRGPRDLSHFVWAFVIAVAILTWMAIFVFNLGKGMEGQLRLGNMYMYDSNDLGVFLLIGIPLTLVVMETSGKMGKAFGALLLVAIGVSLARSGSRGAFLGLISLAGAFFVWANHISLGKRFAAVGVIMLALVATSPPGYWEQMASLTSPKEDYNWASETGRRMLAKRGFGYMLQYPVAGVGIANFNKAEWQLSSMAQEVGRVKGIRGAAAHNSWVQIGAELGVTGLVLWVSLIFGTLLVVARTRKQIPIAWKRGPPEQRFLYSMSFNLPLAIWAFAVPCTFVSHAYMDPMYFLAVLSAGYLVAVRRALRQEPARIPGARSVAPGHA